MRPRNLLAFVLLLLAPMLAWAGNTDGGVLFNLASDDLSKKLILDGIFGDINSNGGAGLSGAVLIFNGIVLTAAGFLCSYTIIAGTMQTAHDGSVLGSRWSSMWVPVRVAIGTAALLPVLNGYNVAQAVVLWTAAQGIGAANQVWQAFTQQPVAAASFIAPDTAQAARSLAENMLLSNVCVQAHNIAVQQSQAAAAANGDPYWSTASTYAATPFNVAPTANFDGSFGYTYGAADDQENPAACGEVTKTLAATDTTSILDTQSETINNLVNMPALNGTVEGAMTSGLTAMQTALVPVARQIALASIAPASGPGTKAPAPADVNSALTAAAQAFSDGVKQSLVNAPSLMNQQVQQNVSKDGWLFAGAWYMKIAKAGQSLSDAVTALPRTSGQTDDRRDGAGPYDFYVNTSMQLARNLVVQGKPKNGSAFTGLAAQANADSNPASAILNWFVADNNLGFGSDANALLGQNPVIGEAQLGRKMLNSAWFALAAGAGGAGAAGVGAGNLAGKLLGGDTAAIIVGNLLTPGFYMLFVPLILGGVSLSLVPMIPALMWGMAVIGYVILLTEAVFGASVWMLAHLHPDGDAFGKGSSGYMLLLQLFLRPPLMVLGLISSIALMTPIGWFFSSLFIGAATESGALAGFAGLTVLIAMMVLYGGVQVVVIRKIFALIHVIPDQILRWIGHSSSGGGAMLGDGMDQAAGATGGAGKTLVGVVPSMNGKGLSDAVKQLKDQRDKRKNAPDREPGGTPITVPKGGDAPGGAGKNGGEQGKDGNADGGPASLAAQRKQASASAGDATAGTAGAAPDAGNRRADGGSAGQAGAKPEADGATGDKPADGSTAQASGLSQSLDAARQRMTAARDRLTDPGERKTESDTPKGDAPAAPKDDEEDHGTA
ncbi:DotA/TraY family protein [Burkholderia cenocepacia]|uniref:DotA/TraY family protein n=1 Tax=Burkholderia cenocepacia TaxID=95486 RepID=UPI001B9F00BD|nr:DotA/TraY family protein [Burkholderia cenocepacia]MBR8384553.1 DotA/TraY family protein [Burkholderia cenocepacia]